MTSRTNVAVAAAVGISFAIVVAAAAAGCAPASQPPSRHVPGGEGEGEGEGEGDAPVIDVPRVQAIVDAYTTSMSVCPEKVWPGHDWSDNRIVLAAHADERAWVWSGASVSGTGAVDVAEVDPTTLPAELWQFDFYSVAEMDGAVALAIDLDETEQFADPSEYMDLAVLLAFHEGFHNLGGQDDFRSVDTGGRDPVLPLDWHPRFIRDEEIRALRGALADGGGGGDGTLGVAGHWQHRYESDAAGDRADLAGLDVIEGTAQYVESVAAIVATLGCDAGDADIAAEAAAHAASFVADPQYDSGGESYALGPAAGLLLRGQGQGFEEAAKETPLAELLLAGVTAADVDETTGDVAARATTAEAAIASVNDDAESRAAPLFSSWDDASTVRIAFSYNALSGSFGYESGYIYGDRDDDAHVLLAVDATFALSDGGSASISGMNVVEDASACGDDVFALPVDPAAATDDAGVITAHIGGLDVTGVHVDEVTAADGRRWWCAR